MNFRATLARHLQAIRTRNLEELAATEFLEAHRAWFASGNWTLGVKEVQKRKLPHLGI